MTTEHKIKNARITLYGAELVNAVKAEYQRRLAACCEHVKNKVQENISEPTKELGPSKPGEYPHAITGRLRNSIFTDVDLDALSGIVGTALTYGLFLEYGTAGGKRIEPVNKKVLSWIDPATGQRRFAKFVIQGAIEGRSYLRRTLMEERPKLKAMLEKPMPNGRIPNFTFKTGGKNQYG